MKKDQNTPMIQAFLEVKNQYPDKLVFYRMGDFYELFYDDAVEASKILGITLTKRGQSNGNPIPMAGVPFHSVESYLNKALKAGKSIVLCEQVGEAGKGLMERQVSKILTPGTAIEQGVLDNKETRYLMVVFKRNEFVDLSWINFSTGEIWCNTVPFPSFYDEVNNISPSEILISEKQLINFHLPNFTVNTIPSWEFDQITCEQNIIRMFGEHYKHKFGLVNNLVVVPISILINYLQETQKTEVNHINQIKWFKKNEFLQLDYNTKKHLELINSNNYGPSLWECLDYCTTPMGSRRLKEWISYPTKNTTTIEHRLNIVEYLYSDKKPYVSWQSIASTWCDIERITARISLKTVKPRELASLRDTLRSMPKLISWIQQLPLNLRGFVEHSIPNDAILKLLERYLLEEPNAWVRDGQVIANGLDTELDECRKLQDGHSNFLKDYEKQEKIATGISNLKVEYNQAQGFFISITNSNIEKAPSHYKRKQTLKNCERYTTKELMNYEEKALSARSKALLREKFLYSQLLQKLQHYILALQKQTKILTEWDILASFAQMAHENNYIRPKFNNQNYIKMVDGLHPIVSRKINNFVPNSIYLETNNNVAIITGPNMGGKSTFMRQLALLTVMSHIGSFVPAKEFNIHENIDAIFTRIGAGDDISHGRSTFMVEMTETSYIVNNATKNSLVLIDELGRGTATYDGLSLAWSIAQYLGVKTGSFLLFATHYLELTELSELFSNIKNYRVNAIEHEEHIIFTHKLELGSANKSYGIHVAELAGINEYIIGIAKQKLNTLEGQESVKKSVCSISEELKNLDVLGMTPIQALNWIMSKKNEL